LQRAQALPVGRSQEDGGQLASPVSELVQSASLQVNVEDMSEEGREATGQGGVPLSGGGEQEVAQEGKLAMGT